MVVLVAIWMKTAWAEGLSTMTGSLSANAKVDLVVTSGRRPRSGWCVVAVVDLGRVDDSRSVGVILLYRLYDFWTRFPL